MPHTDVPQCHKPITTQLPAKQGQRHSQLRRTESGPLVLRTSNVYVRCCDARATFIAIQFELLGSRWAGNSVPPTIDQLCRVYRNAENLLVHRDFDHGHKRLTFRKQYLQSRLILEKSTITKMVAQAIMASLDQDELVLAPGWTDVAEQSVQTKEHWNIGTLEHWNIGTLELWNFGTLELWNFGTLE
jgi:hypothetical protein